MDDSYLEKLRSDLLEQFRGKPNIEVFQKALARQLDELYIFLDQLNSLRTLQTAEGAQLDGIGDIVVLSRADALVISKLADQNVPMDDAAYRRYLAWKIALNTTNCTHKDVYNALKMFWDRSPLYYSEDINHPATIFISTPELSPDDNASVLILAPKVKAAGVALTVIANTNTPHDPIPLRIAATAPRGVMITKLPQYIPAQAFENTVRAVAHKPMSLGETTLLPINIQEEP